MASKVSQRWQKRRIRNKATGGATIVSRAVV